MEQNAGIYAGIDVSLELSSVCVVDGRGKIVKKAKVASEPEALVHFLKELGFPVNRTGFEAGPLSQASLRAYRRVYLRRLTA